MPNYVWNVVTKNIYGDAANTNDSFCMHCDLLARHAVSQQWALCVNSTV